jgi:biofilm protein TabA
MLTCNVKNLQEQIRENEGFQRAIDFLSQIDIDNISLGKIDLDGENVYVRIMEYKTLPFEEVEFEAHKKYIDIHYVINGEEAIWVIDSEKLIEVDEYDSEEDIYCGKPNSTDMVSKIILSKGDLAVFYPSDAHAPKGIVVYSTKVKKMVIKIRHKN